MDVKSILISVLAALCLHAAVSQAEVVLLDGATRTAIVTADKPTPVVRFAAAELQTHLHKMSGVKLPILPESKLPKASKAARILVGDTKLAGAAGLRTADMAPESTLVRAQGGNLILIGGDRGVFDLARHTGNANGTLYAVYDFLQRDLGVRWLWPGEAGTVIPARKTIRVPDLNRAFNPPLIQRNIRAGMRDWSGYMTKLGWTGSIRRKARDEYHRWARRRRLGRRAQFRFGHAYNHWLKKHGQKHPDWFAMMPDGRRVTPERPYPNLERAKLCVTNPELLDFIAKKGMEYLEKSPTVLSFSACPNDSRGYCMCPRCKALDHPDGIKDTMNYPGVRNMKYPSLSDRYVWFWNQLANRMGDRFPGRGIGAYAYSNYRFPPLREKLSKRVIIGYVGYNYINQTYNEQSRKDWAGWAATGCRMYLRPNLLLVGRGFPLNYSREFGADLKKCFRTGMLGTDFDSMTHQYASQAPIFYTLTSLLWDPSADVESILTEFLTAAYGPAEPVMRRYWDRLEKLTKRIARECDPKVRYGFDRSVPRYYTDALLNELRGMLAQARTAAAGRPDVIRRIDVAGVGLEYAEIQRDVRLAVKRYNKKAKNLEATLKILKRKQAFFRKHLSDWTIGLNHVYWREARSTVHAMMYGTILSDAHLHPRKLAKLVDWRFKTDPENRGEALGYARPDFDDSAWKPISSLTFWEQQGYRHYDGYGWYRRKLAVPAEWKRHKKIILRFGAVDESFRLYIDGELVREWLYDGAKDPRLWTKPRPVDITKHVRFGGEHSLAVRVHDSAGAGGIWKSVLIVYE